MLLAAVNFGSGQINLFVSLLGWLLPVRACHTRLLRQAHRDLCSFEQRIDHRISRSQIWWNEQFEMSLMFISRTYEPVIKSFPRKDEDETST